jgi:hypothetical protein
MRITIVVREGDFATTESSFSEQIAYLMAENGTFNGVLSAADGSQRWTQLYRDLRSTACATVDTEASATLADLTRAALLAADDAVLVELEPTADTRSWLADPVTDEKYDSAATVASIGLQDGDLVVLNIEHPPEASYSLMPAVNTARLFSQLQLTDQPQRIAGVLLYTDADVELATFVRTHFDELNALSGDLFQIFVQERPASWRKAKQYWKPRIDPQLYQMLAVLQWLKWVPYDRSVAYEVAQRFGVPPSDLPCLVLLGTDGGRFVFPMRDASIGAYRKLFSDLSETLHGALPSRVTFERQLDLTRYWDDDDPRLVVKGLAARLAEAEQRFRAAMIPLQDPVVHQFKGTTVFIHSGGEAVTENFNFHGQTTFINRPTNTVVTDFQNTHSAAPAGHDLATLLQLVLTSEELGDDGRELVATLIHELAGDLEDPVADQGGARRKLERIKTTVGQAADIAGPALGIVAKILEILP